MTERLAVVFALYPEVTHLDFTGPHQILCNLPGATAIGASLEGGSIEAQGLVFGNLPRLADVEDCDVLCVPGGFGCTDAIANPEFLAQIKRLAAGSRYVTSVCTGSLILAAAGLLQGRRAACHWAWRDMLALFGAIPDAGRVVRDGNIFSGGGVTAGIDFALTLAAEIAGEDYAQMIQLNLEYAPAPPFNAGRPETAPAAILEQVNSRRGDQMLARRAAIERVARSLGLAKAA